MYLTVWCSKNESGEIEISEFIDQGGFWVDIEVLDAIIRSCRASKKNNPQKQRDVENALMLYKMQYPDPRPKEPPKPKVLKHGIVYVMQDTIRGYYKIGFTKSMDTRFPVLKTANPAIEIVAYYTGTFDDEKAVHGLLEKARKRVDREWFSLSESDLCDIEYYFKSEKTSHAEH